MSMLLSGCRDNKQIRYSLYTVCACVCVCVCVGGGGGGGVPGCACARVYMVNFGITSFIEVLTSIFISWFVQVNITARG